MKARRVDGVLIPFAYLCGSPRLCDLYVLPVRSPRVGEITEVRRACRQTGTTNR